MDSPPCSPSRPMLCWVRRMKGMAWSSIMCILGGIVFDAVAESGREAAEFTLKFDAFKVFGTTGVDVFLLLTQGGCIKEETIKQLQRTAAKNNKSDAQKADGLRGLLGFGRGTKTNKSDPKQN